jgi:hypothetical protein
LVSKKDIFNKNKKKRRTTSAISRYSANEDDFPVESGSPPSKPNKENKGEFDGQ